MDTETMTRAELQSALVLHGLDSHGTKAQMKVCQIVCTLATASCRHHGPCLWWLRHAWSSSLCSRVKKTGSTQRPKALRHDKEGRRSRTRVKQQHQSGCSGDDVHCTRLFGIGLHISERECPD